MQKRALFAVAGALLVPLLSNLAGAQRADVPGKGDSALSRTTPGNNTITGVPIGPVHNTSIGVNTLNLTTSGTFNTAVGISVLANNSSGSQNTANGASALMQNTTGNRNCAVGSEALLRNNSGDNNTGIGSGALLANTIGSNNSAIGANSDVAAGDLTNATVIGANAVVDASNKIRLGDANVTVIEGQVPFTFTSDRNQKENFRSVDVEEVLSKMRRMRLASWNYIGHDAKRFRHYGPTAQDFFDAFGHDGVGTIGTPTTITSGDLDGILMIATQALEKRTEALRAENAELKARLEALEHRIGTKAE